MSALPEPFLDMSEIIGLYKEDARRMIMDMRTAAGRWPEVGTGGTARSELRRLSHQLRGSGRTYGFRNVTRISKAVEQIMIKIEAKRLEANERAHKSVSAKIEKLAGIFAQ